MGRQNAPQSGGRFIFTLPTFWLCQNSYTKSLFFMGKSISTAIFHSYVELPEGNCRTLGGHDSELMYVHIFLLAMGSQLEL